MNTAPASTPSPERADPQDQPTGTASTGAAQTRSAGLIALVHKLIAVGKALIATALAPSDEDARSTLPLRFGTFNIALIIARITRGLRLAEALEARLRRNARRLDNPPARNATIADAQVQKPTPADPPPASAPAAALTPEADDAALLRRLPSAKAIADQVRRHPIGVVLDDICRDLGIDCTHPLWREIQAAIVVNGGSLTRHLDGIAARNRALETVGSAARALLDAVPLPMGFDFPTPAIAIGTGPP